MIRVTFALPNQDSWIFDALELAQKASSHSGPSLSKGQIIRDILIPALEVYRPKQEVTSNAR